MCRAPIRDPVSLETWCCVTEIITAHLCGLVCDAMATQNICLCKILNSWIVHMAERKAVFLFLLFQQMWLQIDLNLIYGTHTHKHQQKWFRPHLHHVWAQQCQCLSFTNCPFVTVQINTRAKAHFHVFGCSFCLCPADVKGIRTEVFFFFFFFPSDAIYFWSTLTSREYTFHSTCRESKLFLTRSVSRLWSLSAQWKEYSPLDWCSAPPSQKPRSSCAMVPEEVRHPVT